MHTCGDGGELLETWMSCLQDAKSWFQYFIHYIQVSQNWDKGSCRCFKLGYDVHMHKT